MSQSYHTLLYKILLWRFSFIVSQEDMESFAFPYMMNLISTEIDQGSKNKIFARMYSQVTSKFDVNSKTIYFRMDKKPL